MRRIAARRPSRAGPIRRAIPPMDETAVDPPATRRARLRGLLGPLLVGGAAAAFVALFLLLGGEVLEGDTHALDDLVLRAAQSLRAEHPWFARTMIDVSSLGSRTVLTLFVTVGVGYLLVVRRPVVALLVAVSASCGGLLVSAFKATFARSRPDAGFAEIVVTGLSFPSGHASMSAAVYLTLGALVAATRSSLRERAYVLAVSALLAGLVGASRVALGVHWLTDVLGGWAFGSAWAIGSLLLARRVSR